MNKYKITARGSRLLVNDDAMAVDVNHADLAQLLAAAPEMLESLRELAFVAESVAHLRGMEKDILPMTEKARAAIAKAEGREQ